MIVNIRSPAKSAGSSPRASASDQAAWLRNGLRQMSGVDQVQGEPFAPAASSIGKSREIDWVTELADYARNLDGKDRQRFENAANKVLKEFSAELSTSNWLAPYNLIEVVRQLGTDNLISGPIALAKRLVTTDVPLDEERKFELSASVLVVLCEARGSDRKSVKPLAVKLARLVVALDAPSNESERQHLARVLQKNLPIEREEIDQILGGGGEGELSPTKTKVRNWLERLGWRRDPTGRPELTL
jgi:hypothetical protein